MPSLNGTSYVELVEGSGKIELNDAGTAERRLKCAWGDRQALALAFIGYTAVINGVVIVYNRQAHPANGNLLAYDAQIEPIGKPLGEDTWDYAQVTIKYKTFPYDKQTLVEESLDFSGEVVTLDKKQWDDGSGGKPDKDIQKTVSYVEYQVKHYRVPSLPTTVILNLLNKLNSGAFKGAAANHVLFMGANAVRKTTTQGTESWDIVYKFIFSPLDLRYEYVKGTPKLVSDPGGNKKYDTGDFSALGVGT